MLAGFLDHLPTCASTFTITDCYYFSWLDARTCTTTHIHKCIYWLGTRSLTITVSCMRCVYLRYGTPLISGTTFASEVAWVNIHYRMVNFWDFLFQHPPPTFLLIGCSLPASWTVPLTLCTLRNDNKPRFCWGFYCHQEKFQRNWRNCQKCVWRQGLEEDTDLHYYEEGEGSETSWGPERFQHKEASQKLAVCHQNCRRGVEWQAFQCDETCQDPWCVN